MPNWCSNVVHIDEFVCEDKLQTFSDWVAKQQHISTERGVRPDCATNKLARYMFDITDIDEDEGFLTFTFMSKWSPGIFTILAAARHYQFSFRMEVEEGGDCLYGDYVYDVNEDKLKYRKVPYNVYPDYEDTENNFYDVLEELLQKQPYIHIVKT